MQMGETTIFFMLNAITSGTPSLTLISISCGAQTDDSNHSPSLLN